MIAVRDSIFPAPASSRSGVKFMKGECYTCVVRHINNSSTSCVFISSCKVKRVTKKKFKSREKLPGLRVWCAE